VIRRHITALRLTLMSADAGTAVVVFVAISVARFGPNWVYAWDQAGLSAGVALASWAATWVAVLWLHGLYRLRKHWSALAAAADVLRATTLLALVAFGGLFVVHLPEVSRLFLVALFATELVVALVSRSLIRWALETARRRGFAQHHMLVVGTNEEATAFARRIEAHPQLGLKVIGHLGNPAEAGGLVRPWLGNLEDIERIFHERVIDEVAICLPVSAWAVVEAIARICADEGKVVRIPSDGDPPRLAGASVEPFDGLTVQSIVYGPDRALSLLGKRLIDLVGGTLALAIVSPVLIAIAVTLRATEGSPILFHQRRVGLHGRGFEMLKFRTMVPDAEARLGELAALNEIQGPAFKLSRDPRITRIGAWLRRTSLDELPQLWNVVRGEMSLVGPRPPLPFEVARYDIWHRRRLAMKPGITGLWQVSERRAEDFDRWVSIDLAYIDRWSLWLDLKIMARTIPAMLEGR
jgi:exopolysaccharide biosynthesis polyprenyl glycosylphosphotransferase